MKATRWPFALALLSLTAGCYGSVSHEALRAPLGDPARPPARAARVVTSSGARQPGVSTDVTYGRTMWVRATVTPDGWTKTYGDSIVRATTLIGVHVEDDVAVLGMTWSAPSAPRCAGGHLSREILLDVAGPTNHVLADDEQVHWERPVAVRAGRVVMGRFDEDQPLLGGASIVDVRLVAPQAGELRELCVRVPVTGPDVTYASTRRWSLGWRLAWQRALAFTPGSFASAGLSFGRWAGPVRLALEGTFGGTLDSYETEPWGGTGWCVFGPAPDCDEVTLGGIGLSANGLLWRGPGVALGWSLVPEVLFARVNRYDSATTWRSRSASSGGGRLGLQTLLVSSTLTGVSAHSPTSAALGFEVFLSAAHVWSGDAAGTPITFGVALLGF